MRLGIGSYTFTWAVGVAGHRPAHPLSALELLEAASQLAVGVVQFCDNLPLAGLSAADLEAVERRARELQLQIELGTRGLSVDGLRSNLLLAKRFGAPFVRLVIDSPGDEPTPDETVRRLRPLITEFADAGVRLALENHDRFTSASLVEIVQSLGPDHVGICLDTVNSFGALEGPAHVVAMLAPYTLNLHVKDFTITREASQMGFTVSGCPVGQGRLNVPWLLAQLRAADRDVNAIVELWTPPARDLQATIARERSWANQSIEYLRGWIPR